MWLLCILLQSSYRDSFACLHGWASRKYSVCYDLLPHTLALILFEGKVQPGKQ